MAATCCSQIDIASWACRREQTLPACTAFSDCWLYKCQVAQTGALHLCL